MSGAIVLATLFAATSQALNLLIPDTGLLHAVFAIFIFCQLLTIGAARTDRIGSLRSVVVLFGSLFVLRFILLEGLYSRQRQHAEPCPADAPLGRDARRHHIRAECAGNRLRRVPYARAVSSSVFSCSPNDSTPWPWCPAEPTCPAR